MQAIAKVLLQGNCVPITTDKEVYCTSKGLCTQYITTHPDWSPCIERCIKDSSASVTASVEAIATIDVESRTRCTGDSVGEIYITKLNGSVRPRQTVAFTVTESVLCDPRLYWNVCRHRGRRARFDLAVAMYVLCMFARAGAAQA